MLKQNLLSAIQLWCTLINYDFLRGITNVFTGVFIQVFPFSAFYHRRFRRLFSYFVVFLFVILFIWFNIPDQREELTGHYCKYLQSSKTSVIIANHSDENMVSCSFDQIHACQLIQTRSLLYIISSTAGFVSELNNMLNAFAYSVATKRRFLIDGQQWNYGSFENYFNMNQNGFSPYLFFNEESNDCAQRTFYSMLPSHYQNDRTDHIMVSRDERGFFNALNEVTKDFDRHLFNGLRSIKRKRQVAQFLWQYLFRRTIRTMIDDFRKQHPSFDKVSYFYGMHVRRGDKLLSESFKSLKISDYVSGIEKLAAKLQNPIKDHTSNASSVTLTQTIFAASDAQQTVIEQLKALRPQWNFVHLHYNDQWERSSSSFQNTEGHNQTAFNQLPSERKLYETNMFLTELTILSQADGVVCTFSSNICRFLQLLRKQNESTVLSIDIQWHPE